MASSISPRCSFVLAELPDFSAMLQDDGWDETFDEVRVTEEDTVEKTTKRRHSSMMLSSSLWSNRDEMKFMSVEDAMPTAMMETPGESAVPESRPTKKLCFNVPKTDTMLGLPLGLPQLPKSTQKNERETIAVSYLRNRISKVQDTLCTKYTTRSDASFTVERKTEETEDDDAKTLLHRSCQIFGSNCMVVEAAMFLDPEAVRRPVNGLSVSVTKTVSSESPIFMKKTNDFKYPLNIALYNQAGLQVIEMLAEAAPEVLLLSDQQGLTSLHIALRHWCSGSKSTREDKLKLIQLLLNTHWKAAATQDARGNTPLHVAVTAAKDLSIEIVEALYKAHPQAMRKTNLHGDTPLRLARRSTAVCPDNVVDFLNMKVGLF